MTSEIIYSRRVSTFLQLLVMLALSALGGLALGGQAFAADCPDGTSGSTYSIETGVACGNTKGAPDNLFGAGGIFVTIVNMLLFLVGALSVIMLIWGGIRYTTSGGNSSWVASAKSTITYAIIGLVVAFLAYALVNWVLGSLQVAK